MFQGEDTENGKQAGSRSPDETALLGSQDVVAGGGFPEPEGVDVGVTLGVGVGVETGVGFALGLTDGSAVGGVVGSVLGDGSGGGGATPGGRPASVTGAQLSRLTAASGRSARPARYQGAREDPRREIRMSATPYVSAYPYETAKH